MPPPARNWLNKWGSASSGGAARSSFSDFDGIPGGAIARNPERRARPIPKPDFRRFTMTANIASIHSRSGPRLCLFGAVLRPQPYLLMLELHDFRLLGFRLAMIPKSGNRFSEKIMRK